MMDLFINNKIQMIVVMALMCLLLANTTSSPY